MKYAPRSELDERVYMVCECGHFRHDHSIDAFARYSNCERCMCPKHKDVIALTFDQYSKLSGSLRTPIDWDAGVAKKVKDRIGKEGLMRRFFYYNIISNEDLQKLFEAEK